MSDVIKLDIAGVTFIVACRQPILISEPPESYASFVTENISFDDSIEINLEFTFDSIPDIKKMRKIFETEKSWTLFQNEERYFVILCPPAADKTVWAAEFDRDVKTATIFLGEPFVRKDNGNIIVSHGVFYPVDQILLMYFLAQRQGALIHAAGIEYNGKGFIFPGRSGAGKTTISGQLACSDRLKKLSDDRIAVRKMHNTFQAFGTPWPGEGGIAINKHVPLSGMFFISHAEHNRIEEIKPQKAFEMLLPVTSVPWYDPEVMDKVLLFCNDLTSGIPAYNLSFKPGAEIGDVFEKFIST
ncbi:MAG: hypothetical protein FJ240_13125 [Nitrospira sp.]|nr:hypothetical protein [Nitrospira sp.]